ncbi:MAG: phosphate/phosphite/phosphonate ABC transporter substrate-binding protein [Kiloniellaceae bacterium]
MTVANLPMYDLPEVAPATDSWWRGLARAFSREGVRDVPAHLTRDMDTESVWLAPDLLFSQTCGYPLTHSFRGRLQVVATPVYASPHCDGPEYCSLIVVRDDDPAGELGDLRGRTAAVNNPDSQSGYSALRAAVAPLAEGGRFFGRVVTSGGHANSLALVQGGAADVCASDCVTYALLSRYRPEALEGLRVLGRSPRAPGLPYVTRPDAGEELTARLRAGLFAALEDPDLAAAREALLIAGGAALPEGAYRRIVDIERQAEALGYARVA